MYLFIDEDTIEEYSGEVLKRYVGNKLVKAITNPTTEQLKEFGYKELIDAGAPEHDDVTQYVETKYYDGESIIATYEIKQKDLSNLDIK